MRSARIAYSAAEMRWLEANRTLIISDYHRAFCAEFGRANVSAAHLHGLRKRKGWKVGRAKGRFAGRHLRYSAEEIEWLRLMAGWSVELVRSEIVQLKTLDYDLKLLGFGDAQLVQFTTLPGPPSQFPAVGDDIDVTHECPKCGYVGSGDWTPKPTAQRKGNGKKK